VRFVLCGDDKLLKITDGLAAARIQ